ncbi:endonuclease NucS domain-containing protein [Candidatus Binatus sp.]
MECKRDEVTVESIDQLQRYIDHVKTLTGRKHVRGLLVHGAHVPGTAQA